MASSSFASADMVSTSQAEFPQESWNFAGSKIEVQKLLGKGKYGSIFRVQHTNTKFIFAVETMNKSEMKSASKLKNHLKQHQELKHPYVLRLYGYLHDEENIYLMLQYAPKGKLRDFLDVKGRLQEKEAAHLLVQVVKGALFLHSKGIVHAKINPGNILMQNESHLLLKCPELSTPEKKDISTAIQLNYTAPEILAKSPITQAADIWSIGVLLFEMVCGSSLLDQEEAANFVIPAHVSDRAMNLFPKLIIRNPENRLPLKEILTHSWIKIHTEKKKNHVEMVQNIQELAETGGSAPRLDDDVLPPPTTENPQPKRRTFGGSLENKKNS